MKRYCVSISSYYYRDCLVLDCWLTFDDVMLTDRQIIGP